MIIAIDGFTASGKGTISKALAKHFDLPHLDTGLLYRAVGISVARAGGDPDIPQDALAGAAFDQSLLDDPILRLETTGSLASRVSIHPDVRAALIQRQKDFANQTGGAILDGRDIGTVIAPHADAKLFVTASVGARAARRCKELEERGEAPDYALVYAALEERDKRDSERTIAPSTPAEDAHLLDTSELTIDSAVQQAISLVNASI